MIEESSSIVSVMFGKESCETYWFKRYRGSVTVCIGDSEINIQDEDQAEFIKALKMAFAKERE